MLIRLGKEEEEAKGNEVFKRALLESAVKFRSWSQLSGGCPWWLAGCSELAWCYWDEYLYLNVDTLSYLQNQEVTRWLGTNCMFAAVYCIAKCQRAGPDTRW